MVFALAKIITYEGADVIIPNGDLLSQQLTNWTLTDQTRRIELIVGVAYGSDISNVRKIIHKVISEQEMVIKYPEPLVLVNELSDSSLDFRLLFWTNKFDDWLMIKSELLSSIYNELNKAGVENTFSKARCFCPFTSKG